MNLSHLVNAGRIQQQTYSKSTYSPAQMAVSMMNNPYSSQPQQQYASYIQTVPGPPSPPMEDTSKCSLPGISSLLDIANDPSATQQQQQQLQNQQAQQTQQQHIQQVTEYRNSVSSSRGLPPTPPMQADIGYDGRQSPSASSQYSVVSAPQQQSNFYFGNGMSNMDLQQRPQQQQIPRQRRVSYGSYSATQYNPLQTSSYYPSAMQSTPPPQISGLYYQRPLPQYAPSNMLPMTVQSYQHHHYISPSSASSFTQSQDRYICATCSKAFSRPSSLKIHNHSHTGEKPYKCSRSGCGKAFSVRSNMKRHERGCSS